MTTNGIEVDGLWDIRVLVTDLDMPKILTVKGDLHIGGVMFKLVNSIGQYSLAVVTTTS